MAQLRLDKFLADAGCGTRSEVKERIRKKQVTVNGAAACKPEMKIDPDRDTVVCDGKPVVYARFHYYMLHKPAGVITATEDGKEETVLSLLKGVPVKNLFPVGRLDRDTEGLLLITDNGPLAHRLLSPKYHVDKTYFVRAAGEVSEADLQRLREGIEIGEGEVTLPAKAEKIRTCETEPSGDGDGKKPEAAVCSEVLLTIREGKYHQVKRMFARIGRPVLYLKRLSMGSLHLDENLPAGAFRPLTEAEIAALKREVPAN